MADLNALDTVLANAKVTRANARSKRDAASAAWSNALNSLDLVPPLPEGTQTVARPHGPKTGLPAPKPPVAAATTQLQGLADALIAAKAEYKTADAAVAAAQTAYTAAEKSSQLA